MSGPLEGIRVVEMASWMFVPSAASVLVDWGADVLKVENPDGGDPQRGLISSGLLPGGAGGVNFMVEQPNRGKRSLAINVAHPDGREAFMKVVETADVFLTNYLPSVRQRLGIDVEDLRSRNPDLIVARGSGQGPKGPDAEKGGYDGASFWARGGVSAIFPEGPDGWPQGQPSPAFGDVMGGLAIAGAISAALVRRERTGEPSVVDVSLLATAMWQVSPLVVASKLFGFGRLPAGDRTKIPNPGVNTYRTSDDRFISLILLQSDKHWDDLCERLDRTDLATDPRFCDSTVRAENAGECIAQLDEAFARRAWSTGRTDWRTSRASGLRSRPSPSSTRTSRPWPTTTSRPWRRRTATRCNWWPAPPSSTRHRSASNVHPNWANTPRWCSTNSGSAGTNWPP